MRENCDTVHRGLENQEANQNTLTQGTRRYASEILKISKKFFSSKIKNIIFLCFKNPIKIFK